MHLPRGAIWQLPAPLRAFHPTVQVLLGLGSARKCILTLSTSEGWNTVPIFFISHCYSLCVVRVRTYSSMAMSPAPSLRNSDDSDTKPSVFNNVSNKASAYHARVPYLSKLPFPAIAIIVTLIVVNLIVWAAVGVVLVSQIQCTTTT